MKLYIIISSLAFLVSAIVGVRSILNINVILDRISTNSSQIRHKWIWVKNFSVVIVGLFLLFCFLVFTGPNHYLILVISLTLALGTVLVYYIIINSKDTIEKLTKIERYLLHTVDDLQVTNQSLEEFAYVATHDLRSPVVNLKNLLNFFDETYEDKEGNAEVMEKFKKSIGILDRTLNALIEVVMLKNTSDLINEKIPLKQLVDDIIISLDAEIKSHEILVNTKVDDHVYIIGHPSKMHSIVANLVTNAIKYRSPNRKPVVSITVKETEFELSIKVSDNGIGIDMNQYGDRIFGLFNRIHNDDKGKGIGLYNVKNQIEAMGGSISVDSMLDVGSTFIISFKKD